MMTREATEREYAALDVMGQRFGFHAPRWESPLIEAVEVVTGPNGEVLMGAVAQRTAEIYLFCPEGVLHPQVKMEGIRLLHGAIRDKIAPKGYTEGFSFVAPQIERSFGRHLVKRFGWEKCWTAYRVLDWKGEPCQKA